MKLEPFLLDHRMEAHRGTHFDLAASTGPVWTVRELLELAGEDAREAFLDGALSYCPSAGHADLRQAVADLHGADPDDVQILTGAAEALAILFFLAAEPGANIVVPTPCFPTFTEVPRGFDLEVRQYRLRPEIQFAIDVDEVRWLVNGHTKLILVNSPHNPSGAVAPVGTLRALHDFAAERYEQFVVDEVYHPIYHGEPRLTAATLPHATIPGDFSKAFSLSGLRTGWILDRNSARLARYFNARSYFSVSNSMPGERLAVLAARHSEAIFERAYQVAGANLALLEQFFGTFRDTFDWVRPEGGFAAFPSLRDSADAGPLCEAAVARDVIMSPGDCFGMPSHFRIGLGACAEGYADALELVGEATRSTVAVAG